MSTRWFPRWLDRLLPLFDVEGEGLQRELDLADWPEDGDRMVVAADSVVVADRKHTVIDGITVMLPAGDALVVTGGDVAQRSALLLVLAARIPVVGGRLKVAGFALPMRTSSVRAQAAVVRAARSADPVAEVREALARKAPLVVIDDLDAVFHEDARAALARMLTDARLDALERETTLSLIVSRADPDGADDVHTTEWSYR